MDCKEVLERIRKFIQSIRNRISNLVDAKETFGSSPDIVGQIESKLLSIPNIPGTKEQEYHTILTLARWISIIHGYHQDSTVKIEHIDSAINFEQERLQRLSSR